MSTHSREEVQGELHYLLRDAFCISEQVASEVYRYTPADLQGESPVVSLMAAGTSRSRRTRGQAEQAFLFLIVVSVLYKTQDNTGDELEAQAILNAIDDRLNTFIDTHHSRDSWWTSLQQVEGFSDVSVATRKEGYLVEITPIAVTAA